MRPSKRTMAGASLLEFLITIPVLLTFAYMAIEFGGLFVRLDTVTKSVQDAARYLSDVSDKSLGASPNTATQKTNAQNLVISATLSTSTQLMPGTFQTPTITYPDANHVRVSVIYNHTPLGGQTLSNLVQMLGGGPVNFAMQLPASSTMRLAQ